MAGALAGTKSGLNKQQPLLLPDSFLVWCPGISATVRLNNWINGDLGFREGIVEATLKWGLEIQQGEKLEVNPTLFLNHLQSD